MVATPEPTVNYFERIFRRRRWSQKTRRPEFRPHHPIQHDNPGVSMMEDENGTLHRDPPLDPSDYEDCD